MKVSPDGRYAALSREGASNRRNGVVILDLADPAHPIVASTFDEGLTGGVHNMFATDDYLFALSGGRQVRDPRRPGHPQSPLRERVQPPRQPRSTTSGCTTESPTRPSGERGRRGRRRATDGGAAASRTRSSSRTSRTRSARRTRRSRTSRSRPGKFYLFLGDEIMIARGRGVGRRGSRSDPGAGRHADRDARATSTSSTSPIRPTRGTWPATRPPSSERTTCGSRTTSSTWRTTRAACGWSTCPASSWATWPPRVVRSRCSRPSTPTGYTANAPMAWGAAAPQGVRVLQRLQHGSLVGACPAAEPPHLLGKLHREALRRGAQGSGRAPRVPGPAPLVTRGCPSPRARRPCG